MNSGMFGTGNVLDNSPVWIQAANTAFAGPASGYPAALSFRELVPADFPARMAEFFGQGDDGDYTISSSNLTSGPFTNGALTRDAHIRNLTMVPGGSIVTTGYRLFVRGVLDIRTADANAIKAPGVNGQNAAGFTAGGSGTSVFMRALGCYGIGGAGSNGVSTGNSAAATGGAGLTADHTGRGGNGGAGGAGSTGTPAASPSNSPNNIDYRIMCVPTNMLSKANGLTVGGCGGGGGTGGTGDGTNLAGGGGGGGSSGGVLFLGAHTIIRGSGTTAGCISAIGGNGGTGADGSAGNAGGGAGGGGGSGGLIRLVYHELLGPTVVNALDVGGGTGSAGGNGSGTGLGGDSGGGGAAGRVFLIEYMGTTSSSSWAVRMQTGSGTAVNVNLNVGSTGGVAAAGVTARFNL